VDIHLKESDMLRTSMDTKQKIQKIKEIIDAGVIFAYDDRAERIFRLTKERNDDDLHPLTKLNMLIEELEDSLQRNQDSPNNFLNDATKCLRLIRKELEEQGV
jgi:hypothetical protein